MSSASSVSCSPGAAHCSSGRIGTFDDLFEEIARAGGSNLPVATDAQRQLIVRAAVAQTSLNGLGASARFSGFSDALGAALAELESGLVEPDQLSGDLALLYSSYQAELQKLGLWDRDLRRRHAADLVSGELDAWSGRPVFAYGFEDLTGAQWALLEALAGRTDVTVSLPYEPNRAPFESLTRTSEDLSSLADGAHRGAPARLRRGRPAGARPPRAPPLRRPPPPAAPELQGSIRFLEGAGARGTLELVADEVLKLIRAGTKPEEILARLPECRTPARTARDRPERARGAICDRGPDPDRQDRVRPGAALVPALRVARWRAPRPLRLPALAVLRADPRAHVDYLEGRLRGRAVSDPARVVEETLKLRGQPLRVLDAFRGRARPPGGRPRARPLDDPRCVRPRSAARRRGRRSSTCARTVPSPSSWTSSSAWIDLGGALSREELYGALERATLRLARGDEPGRVAVTDLLRARTRRTEVVFLLGLEEGSFPRRAAGLALPRRRGAPRRSTRRPARARLTKPDAVSRERYFFYTACTRPSRRLYLVREAATDDGSPREPSPFWDEARALFDAARRRPLDDAPAAARSSRGGSTRRPTERERLRALSALAAADAGRGASPSRTRTAGTAGSTGRAAAFSRPTRLTDPVAARRAAGAGRPSPSPSSRASPTAPRSGSSSA